MLSVVLLAVDTAALPVLRALNTPLLVRVDMSVGARPAFKPVLVGPSARFAAYLALSIGPDTPRLG